MRGSRRERLSIQTDNHQHFFIVQERRLKVAHLTLRSQDIFQNISTWLFSETLKIMTFSENYDLILKLLTFLWLFEHFLKIWKCWLFPENYDFFLKIQNVSENLKIMTFSPKISAFCIFSENIKILTFFWNSQNYDFILKLLTE